ncbi:MAG: hypothetical protein K6A82_03925 [Prevotella sp.]|nr:hypothetical protein [Prevotella sp.]
MRKTTLTILALLLALSVPAQRRSDKRGISWDEKNVVLTDANLSKMQPGISWLYNWGVASSSSSSIIGTADGIAYIPMCWNGDFNETTLRNWLKAHPGTKYLLGFNEPNLSWNVGGAQMTPQQAAAAWPKLEKIADEFQLELVAPALNFSGDNVGGRVYSTPFDWLEEFVKIRPTARIDYLCLHCYMDYASAVKWFATEYFYGTGDGDLYGAANKAKYPNLIRYFDTYGEKKMFLTEFCAYGNDFRGNSISLTEDVQIDHMTQKLQYLEQSEKVAAYAWFIGNGNSTQAPHNSLFLTASPSSELSPLGKVYVYSSSFDKEKYYSPDEPIQAKDYVDASTDDQQVRLRPNSETATAIDLPLQVEFLPSSWASYQVDVPQDGIYQLTLHGKSSASTALWIYVDKKKTVTPTLPSTQGAWQDNTISITLKAGRHTLMLFNTTQSSFFLNKFRFSADALAGIVTADAVSKPKAQSYYSLDGTPLSMPTHGVYIQKSVDAEGNVTAKKVIKK